MPEWNPEKNPAVLDPASPQNKAVVESMNVTTVLKGYGGQGTTAIVAVKGKPPAGHALPYTGLDVGTALIFGIVLLFVGGMTWWAGR